MRVAALYDVHAMPWALEAVLADAGDADALVFGGDYLYGPYPRETVAAVRALDARVELDHGPPGRSPVRDDLDRAAVGQEA